MALRQPRDGLLERSNVGNPQATSGYSSNQYGDVNVAAGARVHLGNQHYHVEHDPQKVIIKQMVDLLSFPEMHDRFDSISDAEKGTYNWIQDPVAIPEHLKDKKQQCSAIFSQWYFRGTGMFWISGKPGSGKSTLTKHLLQETIALRASSSHRTHPVHSTSFAYFFWLNGTSLQRTISGFLRSLLCQCLQNDRTSYCAVSVLVRLVLDRHSCTNNRLQEAVLMILSQAGILVHLFLDGLDECDSPRELLRIVQSFEGFSNLKICVSSRPEQVFVDTFENTPSIKLQNVNFSDIQMMVEQRFLQDPQVQRIAKREKNQESFKNIASIIVDRADGVFLWALLVIKDVLEGVSSRDDHTTLQHRVERMPRDISQLYESMLMRGSGNTEFYKSQASLYFRLVLAHDGLDCNLLHFSIVVDESLRRRYLESLTVPLHMGPTGEEIDMETFAASINTRTSGLLQVKQLSAARVLDPFDKLLYTRVNFVHRTAVDFVRDGEGRKLLDPCSLSGEELSRIEVEAHFIRWIVVTYLRKQYISLVDVRCLINNLNDDLSPILFHTVGKTIWNELVGLGSVIVEHECPQLDSIWSRCHDQKLVLPVSQYANPDMGLILAHSGYFKYVNQWLDHHDRWHDTQYLSCLFTSFLLGMVLETGWLGSYSGEIISEEGTFFNKLLAQGASIFQVCCEDYQDLYLPIVEVLILEAVCREIDQHFLSDVFHLRSIDDYLISTSSLGSCHRYWYTCDRGSLYVSAAYSIAFWGDFSVWDIATSCSFSIDSSFSSGPSSSIKIALVQYDTPTGVKTNMYLVSKAESQRLLHGIRGIACYWRAGTIEIQSASYPGTFFPSDDYPMVKPFAAAMKILGKSQEMIRAFYEREAVRMQAENAATKQGWEEWFWGSERPDDLEIGPILP